MEKDQITLSHLIILFLKELNKNCIQHRIKLIAGFSLLTKVQTDFLGSCFIY